MAMLALTVDSAKNIAILVVIALVVFAVLTAKFVASATKKAIFLLVFGGLAMGVWNQRQSLQTCADNVKANIGKATTCSFIGKEISIPGVDNG
jgi:protein-S-isoprenylcysteine O-methyltransferase Ste14